MTEEQRALLDRLSGDLALTRDVARWIEQSEAVGSEAAFVAYRQKSGRGPEAVSTFELKRRLGDSSNRLFHGDNLAALKRLAETSVQANCIYIDPPFGTKQQFLTKVGRDWAYCDAAAGAEYLSMLRERLVLLREVLAEDGTIFVHLDSAMVAEVKMLLDELFGQKNFRCWLTRRKCSSKNFTRRSFGDISDYILIYSKTKDYYWSRQYQTRDDAQEAIDFPKVDRESGRRFALVPVHAPGIRHGASGSKWRDMSPPPGKHWQWTPDQLEELDRNGDIHWTKNGTPRRKMWADQSKGSAMQNILLDYRDPFTQNHKITGYPTEKNIDLLKMLISAATRPRDLVIDCFAGSGTTLEAAASLDRAWIGADIGQLAIATIQRRLATRYFDGTLLEQHAPPFGFELWADPSLEEAEGTGDGTPWFELAERVGAGSVPEIVDIVQGAGSKSVPGQRIVTFDESGRERRSDQDEIQAREKRPA